MRLSCSERITKQHDCEKVPRKKKVKKKKGKKKEDVSRKTSVDIIFAALELRSWHTLMKNAPVSSLTHTCASKLMWDCDCGTPVRLWCTCGWPMVLHKTFWSPKCIEQLSEGGLREWMPLLGFHSCSHERSQLPLLDQFLSRCWLTLCVTMQAEPRIVKQYICHCCCTCKNYRGKVTQDERKVSLHRFSADQKIANLWKKGIFLGKFLLVARHTLTTGLQKMPLNLALETSQIHCHCLPLLRKYAL